MYGYFIYIYFYCKSTLSRPQNPSKKQIHLRQGIPIMKYFKVSILIFFCAFTLHPGQISKAENLTFRLENRVLYSANKLIRGIRVFPKNGTPGPLQVFGKRAAPIIIDDKSQAVAAYTAFGKGSAVAMGHNSWLGKKMLQRRPVQRFIFNCLGLSRRVRPRILTFNADHVYNFLNKNRRIRKTKSLPGNLNNYDIIFSVIPTRGEGYFQEKEVQRIKNWISKGGIFIGASIGWVYRYYGPGKKGKDISKDFVANKLFMPLGIHYSLGYAKGKHYTVQPLNRRNKNFKEAHTGYTVNEIMENILRNHQYRSYTEAAKEIKRLFRKLDRVPTISWLLSDKQIKTVMDLFLKEGNQIFPSLKNPVDIRHARQTGLILLIDKILRSTNQKRENFLRISNDFPGTAERPKNIVKEVTIDTHVPRWHFTGLWIDPFNKIKVTVPLKAVSMGLKIRIGCHKDNLFLSKRRKAWERWPNITHTLSLKKETNRLSSPYAGLIYIDVPYKLKGKINITIEGATPAPHYVLGETSETDWRQQLKNTSSPLGEIEGKYVIIETNTDALRKDYNPEKIIRFWDRAMEAIYDLAQTAPKPYKERYVIDRQLTAGYMHSGYPIVTSYKPDMGNYVLGFETKRGKLLQAGSWGHFHEAGHNNQNRDWTFNGSGEVTVNLFTLYAMEQVLKIKPLEHKSVQRALERKKKYIAAGSSFAQWKKDPILALLMYIELQQKFGWDSFKKVFRVYNDLPKKERPKNDAQKRDQWVLRYSLAVGHDLSDFFESWGLPFKKEIKVKLRHLPKWK